MNDLGNGFYDKSVPARRTINRYAYSERTVIRESIVDYCHRRRGRGRHRRPRRILSPSPSPSLPSTPRQSFIYFIRIYHT